MMEAKQRSKLSPEQPFEEVLELVQPMITAILLKCRVYKNYEYYRHIASIAVWEAWQKADVTKGSFSSYIYTTIKGDIMKELSREQRYNNSYITIEDEKLNILRVHSLSIVEKDQLTVVEKLFKLLTKDELELLQLIYVDGHSYFEIAQQLSISIDATKKRRTRLMAKIRSLL